MKRSERGSNLVEFAIVLPLLVLILAGMADVGRAFNDYIVITNAAARAPVAALALPCVTDANTQAGRLLEIGNADSSLKSGCGDAVGQHRRTDRRETRTVQR